MAGGHALERLLTRKLIAVGFFHVRISPRHMQIDPHGTIKNSGLLISDQIMSSARSRQSALRREVVGSPKESSSARRCLRRLASGLRWLDHETPVCFGGCERRTGYSPGT